MILINGCSNPTSNEVMLTGGVILTFDDHNIDEWVKADSILHVKKWKATFCISEFPSLTEKEKSWILHLQQNGNEIACHGTNHERATYYIEQHSVKEYLEREIYPSIVEMERYGLDITSFAYPGGVRDSHTDSVLLNYFSLLRGTTFNTLPPEQHKCFTSLEDHDSLVYAIGIDSHYKHMHLDYIKTLLQFAKEKNKIIIFYGHKISLKEDEYVTTYSTLNFISDYVNENKMKFYTLRDLAE